MFDQSLTIEKGLKILGEPIDAAQLVLTEVDQCVQDFKEYSSLIDEALLDRYIVVSADYSRYVEGPNINNEKKFDRMYDVMDKIRPKLAEVFKMEDLGFIRRQITPCELQEYILEMVLNAVEHGTDFCSKGEVVISSVIGQQRQLWVVSQPTKGIDFKNPNHTKIRDVPGCMYVNKAGRVRGVGANIVLGINQESCEKEIRFNGQNFEKRWGVVLISRNNYL